MNQTEACTFVLTHIATEMRNFCCAQSMTADQTLRVITQTLQHPVVRRWAATQVIRLAPAA